MWSLNNQTIYQAERGWIRDINGTEVWVVAVKVTYDLLPNGRIKLSKNQIPINTGPVMSTDGKFVLYETDLGPRKNSTDIIINGQAWSPDGKPVTTLTAGFSIQGKERKAKIFGERIWDGERYSDPQPFINWPLEYQYMSKGIYNSKLNSYTNPLGIGNNDTPIKNKSKLPNICFSSLDDKPEYDDVGFGVIQRNWPSRNNLAGTYDDNWKKFRYPLLPEDFNNNYWQISPCLQHCYGKLRGNELITLNNITPPNLSDSGIYCFNIPKLSVAFRTYFVDGTVKDHRARIHTVIIEPDLFRFSVVWHTDLPCHRLVNQLYSTIIIEKGRGCFCA